MQGWEEVRDHWVTFGSREDKLSFFSGNSTRQTKTEKKEKKGGGWASSRTLTMLLVLDMPGLRVDVANIELPYTVHLDVNIVTISVGIMGHQADKIQLRKQAWVDSSMKQELKNLLTRGITKNEVIGETYSVNTQ